MATSQECRLDWIDTIKGIGILFVVAGHTMWPSIQFSVYLFHMPLFFIISGFLFKEKKPNYFLASKTKTLLIPYISYLLIFSAYEFKNIYFNRFHTSDELWQVFYNMVYGGQMLKGSLGVFWFVSVLFISQQILNLTLNIVSKRLALVVMIIIYSISYLYPLYIKSSPLDILVVLNALPYMYIGMLLRNKIHNIKLFIPLVLCSIYFAISYLYPTLFSIDMKSSDFGIPLISTIGCISIFIVLSKLSMMFSGLRSLKSIGTASMTIMFTHQFINIYIARAIFENQLYIFGFCVIQSFMIHILIERNRVIRKILIGS